MRTFSFIVFLFLLTIKFNCTLFFEPLMDSINSDSNKNDSIEVEFSFTKAFLYSYFIFRDSLPENPDIYANDSKKLYNAVTEPYTVYYNPQEAEVFLKLLTTEDYGMGIWVDSVYNGILIKDVTPKSPAEKSGLLKGDTILEINGVNVIGLQFDSTLNFLAGKIGDEKILKIKRKDTILDIYVTIDNYLARSVYTDSLDTNIAYILFTTFSTQTCNDSGSFGEFLEAIKKTSSYEYTIIDLRDNTGGEVEQCINISSIFTPVDTPLVKVTQRELSDLSLSFVTIDTFFYSVNTNIDVSKRKFFILTNGWTASASEIFISALKTYRSDIKLIGEKTYGKGRGQVISSSFLNGLCKVTYAVLKPVNAPEYDMKGILPDIEVEGDIALEKAIEIITNGRKLIYKANRYRTNSKRRPLEPILYKFDNNYIQVFN